jgi:hypothetical protein
VFGEKIVVSKEPFRLSAIAWVRKAKKKKIAIQANANVNANMPMHKYLVSYKGLFLAQCKTHGVPIYKQASSLSLSLSL